MDEIFPVVDRTLSTPGEQLLYNILRTPLLDKESFQTRSREIRLFQDNKELREKLQFIFQEMGHQKGNFITSLIWEELTFFSRPVGDRPLKGDFGRLRLEESLGRVVILQIL